MGRETQEDGHMSKGANLNGTQDGTMASEAELGATGTEPSEREMGNRKAWELERLFMVEARGVSPTLYG